MLVVVVLAILLFAFQQPSDARGLPQHAACMACHGEKEMKLESGKSIYVDAAKLKASNHAALGCQVRHTDIKDYPHPKRITKPQCSTCHAEPAASVPKSVHGALGAQACASCHGNVHEVRRASVLAGQDCATCHADVVRDYKLSTHCTARKNGDADTPLCLTCHGSAHKIVRHSDPSSPVAKRNLSHTCGSCHANPEFLARHKIPYARPVEAYRLSWHGRQVEAGNQKAPSCSDCHASHGIFRATDPRSKINHWNVPATCGACHGEIQKTYAASVHGQAVARGVEGSPVCTSCHGEHSILAPSEPQSLVNPARVSSVTCGHCHSDERLAARYNLPLDKVPAFQDSFHGLAARSGSQTVANCASCHGVHNILRSDDPRSTINPKNIGATCGACHTGAGGRFAIGRVHVLPETTAEHPVAAFIRVAYLWLIPLALGFMVLHNGLDFFAKLARGGPRVRTGEEVPRMNLHFRIAHWLTVLSFPTLVITGFALKFPESWWAAPIVQWEGQMRFRATTHRIAAVVLIASIVYHAVHLILRRHDRIILRNLLPRLKDVTDLRGTVRYNLGLSQERPHFGMFSYAENIEYLAYMWGSVVMAGTGFLLWFENFTLRNFPKWVADAATAVHYYEAILATLSILIWHFYMVIFDPDVYPMDKSWWNGKASADHLKHTRPEYYAEIVSKQEEGRTPPEKSSG
ncbi:MAG: cytochrome b/b6 domain-containing protein [Acidobacteria bacterium]|nr:cytochrome b/b6 domain-containing protein [Acidobacteriota bacterium]MBI3661576.1 cytochrome b/b6 domain-containing protein [Acidobacteriota bacterium]